MHQLIVVATKDTLSACFDSEADVVELRLDMLSLDDISHILLERPKPVLLTFRESDLDNFESLLAHHPDYIDIPCDINESFLLRARALCKDAKIIRSYHNFDETPDALCAIRKQLEHPACNYYKVVTTANDCLDNFKIFSLLKMPNTIAHAMGEQGVPSRVLGKILGSAMTYTHVGQTEIAPGMLDIKSLLTTYRHHLHNANTTIYALIGNPVVQSPGHVFHNDYFHQQAINSVYVKFQLQPVELKAFFKVIKAFPVFKGFSVTIPLKTAVLPFVQHDNLLAINTIKTNPTLAAINTDGMGALNALSISVKNKKLLILSAGGTAMGITQEALKRGIASICIANRTPANAKAIQKLNPAKISITSLSKQLPVEAYDIVINTLPATVAKDWEEALSCHPHYLNVNYTQSKHGLTMFNHQAKAQQVYWQGDV